MHIRKAIEKDITKMMEIIHEAVIYFQSKRIDQWQNGYPNEEVLLQDIQQGNSYLLEKDTEIVGIAYIAFEEDPYYAIIDGKWLNDDDYGVIHRIAITTKEKGNGYASELIKYAIQLAKERNIYNLRMDTYEENISMQKLLDKNGFQKTGVIYIQDNQPRWAYQKVIKG